MYSVKNLERKTQKMTGGQVRELCLLEITDRMNSNIDNANEWSKWFFLYDDFEKINIDKSIKILEEIGYKISRC